MKKFLVLMTSGVLFQLVSQAGAVLNPSSVLIVVNDATNPENGTTNMPASLYVGNHYAALRNIPESNIVHLNIPYGVMKYTYEQFINSADYYTYIQQPIQTFIAQNGLTNKINYIVPCYGVPVMTADRLPGDLTNDASYSWRISIDSLLAGMNAGVRRKFLINPYYDPSSAGAPPHIADWTPGSGSFKPYMVSRLDGPNAILAAQLVDKAIAGERDVQLRDYGTAYFDYQHRVPDISRYYMVDQTISNAYKDAVGLGMNAILHDQTVTAGTLPAGQGANASWVWGWYGPIVDAYPRPMSGAVGAQMTSYTCNSIRDGGAAGTDSNWCVYFLNQGFTATWGESGEPLVLGPNGDSLLGHFWRGYTFGEAATLSNLYFNWMGVFVGDPLYAPAAFHREAVFTLPTGYVTLVSKISEQCLDVPTAPQTAFGQAINLQLEQFTCWGGPMQQFLIQPISGGYKITAKTSGLQLEAQPRPGQQGIEDGVPVVQSTFRGLASQTFLFSVPDPEGYVTITNGASGKCLDVITYDQTNFGQLAGARVQQWSCSGGPMQKWKIIPVSTVGSN